MPQRYILYGWQLSLYSGKTRAYLRYKGIPYVEKPVRLWTMRAIANGKDEPVPATIEDASVLDALTPVLRSRA